MSPPLSSNLGVTCCGDMEFGWGERTYIMGVVNLSPDSFSGDGIGNSVEAAVAQAHRFVAEGADIIDIGGESTRPSFRYPGSTSISVDEELRRVMPVLERLAGEVTVPLSIDSYKAEVVRRAVAAGAGMINDVWGLKKDPEVARVAAEEGLPLILMHNQQGTTYSNLVPDVLASLKKSIEMALAVGVEWGNIIVDPGIGFGKTLEHNLEVMRRLDEFRSLERPILLGTSRKSLIGLVLNLPPDQRLEGTAATVALGIAKGVDMVRVHDVGQMVRVCRMSDAIIRGRYISTKA